MLGLQASRIRAGEWVVLAGSLVLLVAMLAFSWASVPNPGGEGVIRTPIDGWHALHVVRWFVVVTAACGIALWCAQAARRSPAIPVTLSVFAGLLGILTVIALLIRTVIDPPDGIRFGGVLALVGACLVAYGGWRSTREEGLAPQDVRADIPVVDPSSAARPPGGS